MTTSPLGAAEPSRRTSNRTPLLWALVAAVVLIIAAAWPVGGNAPSVLSAATADTSDHAMPSAVVALTRDPSLPAAADALAGKADDVEDQAPTF